jgi:hypothetical protein
MEPAVRFAPKADKLTQLRTGYFTTRWWAAVMNDPRPLAQNDGRFRPPRDCFAPYGFGQYVILNVG